MGSHQRRLDGDRARGYFRADLADLWMRYLPAPEPVTSGTSVTPDRDGSVGAPPSPEECPAVVTSVSALASTDESLDEHQYDVTQDFGVWQDDESQVEDSQPEPVEDVL